jgi:hypothetical protein
MSSLEKYGITMTEGKDEAWGRIGGVSPKVLGTSNGKKVLIKAGTHHDSRDCLAEYFAYKLGQAIGIAVNEVKLIDCGLLIGLDYDLCSVHTWEEDFITANNYGGKLDSGAEDRLALFDEILYNDDRHGSNYGVLNDNLFCIDHGFAEPWGQRVYQDGRLLLNRVAKETTKEVVEKFMSLTVYDFEEMVKSPIDIKYNEELCKKTAEIVSRMLKVQEIIREYKKEMAA